MSVYNKLYRCTSCKYIFRFYDLGINLQIFFISQLFVEPVYNMNYKGKQRFKESRW